MAQKVRIRSSVAAPIGVDGRLWSVMVASSRDDEPLAADTESRIASFTELVATAISNTEARIETARLAREQAALRRVATLVAQARPADELFRAVAEEVGALLGADLAGMARYDADNTVTVLASSGATGERPAVGTRWPTDTSDLAMAVRTTGRPARVDRRDGDHVGHNGLREDLGIRSSVASPIVVDGRLWGGLIVDGTRAEPLRRTPSRGS
jgi:transcriptional regulator with GAF, ATPase, and Fis domain